MLDASAGWGGDPDHSPQKAARHAFAALVCAMLEAGYDFATVAEILASPASVLGMELSETPSERLN